MVFHGFAPTDALDEKVRFTDDQINVFSKAFLSLTVSCARCHHHKFDPISQDDYYALFGILNSTRPGIVAIDLPERLDLYQDKLAAIKASLRPKIADSWIEAVSKLDWNHAITEAEDPKHPFHALSNLPLESNPKFESTFRTKVLENWRRQLQPLMDHQSRDYPKRWDLGEPDQYR